MQISHIILAILVAAIWGCNFVFIKIGVHEIPPLFLCALRFSLASVPAIFFIKMPKPFKPVILYGLVMFALQFSLMFSSFSAGMTAGMGSLIGQTQIFFSVLFAVIFLGERPTLWQILGAAIAFVGIGMIGFHVDSNITLHGLEFIIAAAATWGLGNLIIKKLGKINIAATVAWGSLISCFPLFLFSFLFEGQEKIINSLNHFSWMGFISLAYIVYASTWIGYGVWNWLLSLYPVTMVVPFTLLVPIFGVVSSILLLGESFESWKIIAAFLVIFGLSINLVGPRLKNLKKKTTPMAQQV